MWSPPPLPGLSAPGGWWSYSVYSTVPKLWDRMPDDLRWSWYNNNRINVCVKLLQSCPALCNPMDCPWDSPGKNTGVGCHALLQGIFPTEGLNPTHTHTHTTHAYTPHTHTTNIPHTYHKHTHTADMHTHITCTYTTHIPQTYYTHTTNTYRHCKHTHTLHAYTPYTHKKHTTHTYMPHTCTHTPQTHPCTLHATPHILNQGFSHMIVSFKSVE